MNRLRLTLTVPARYMVATGDGPRTMDTTSMHRADAPTRACFTTSHIVVVMCNLDPPRTDSITATFTHRMPPAATDADNKTP